MLKEGDRVLIIMNSYPDDPSANIYIGHTCVLVKKHTYDEYNWEVLFDDLILRKKNVYDQFYWNDDEMVRLEEDNKDYKR